MSNQAGPDSAVQRRALQKLDNQWLQILFPVIEPVAGFTQIEMEEIFRHAAIRIEPVLRIGSEPLDPVDVVASDRPSLLLADHHMVAPQTQRGIGLPLVRLVERTLAASRLDHLHDGGAVMGLDRLCLHQAVALDDPEYDHLGGRAPAPLALAGAAERGFIAF